MLGNDKFFSVNIREYLALGNDEEAGVTRPRQHRHLKRKDSIRFLVLLVFSGFFIFTG